MSRWLADRKTTNRRFRKRRNCARASGHSFFRRSHMDADAKKKAAALAALEYVEDGMTVGVGTGSTVNHFIAALKERRHRIAGAVSSSEASTRLLKEAGIEVRSLNDTGDLDLYVDGADEVDPPPRPDQGRRRRAYPGKDRGGGEPALRLHRRRFQARRRARSLSPPRRGHPDGALDGRPEARRARRAAGAAPGLQDRQRQRDPRRA